MKLKRLREARKLSLSQLSKLTGISKTTLSDLENGLRVPHQSQLEKLAQVLGVTVDEIL